MNDFVELLDPWRRAAGNAECSFGQPGTVDASVGIQDLAAEAADDFVIDCASRLHERVRDGIRIGPVRTEFDKHLADNGLAARNATGKAEF
jgi:hypothetical protein